MTSVADFIKLEKKGFITTFTDEKDKRKQRIMITDACMAFCEKNDNEGNQSQYIVRRIFEGIDEKALITTIETIMTMERNLSKI